MLGVHHYLERCGLDERLLNLVYLRAAGEPEQKLYMLNAWREWHEFTDRERAALEWTEAVTINSWNRLNIAFRTKAGGYQPRARQ